MAPGDEDTSAANIAEEGASLVFILQFLWLLKTKAYTVEPVNMSMSFQAGDWAQCQHTQWITQPMLPSVHPPGLSTAAFAQQLGNVALAINRNSEDRAAHKFLASQQPATTRSGFESFPTLTQCVILHAASQLECGDTRTAPVASYTELLGFVNVVFVRSLMHT